MAATRLSFSYPEELKEKLQLLAKASNRTLSSYVQNLLAEHIADSVPADKPVKKKTRKKRKRIQL